MSTEVKKWPGETDETFAEIFTKPPPQPTEKKPGQLSQQQLKQFFEEGYVVLDKFFTPEELDPCKDAISKIVDDFAQWLFKHGKIKNLYEEYGLYQRLIYIEKEFPGANIILHKAAILPKAFQDVWANDRLLNAVEQLIGPEIAGHPVYNMRTKTPQNEATTVPWHQDVGYLSNESYKVLQPTAWIPMIDADEKNGCLQIVKGGHKQGRVCVHSGCWGTTHYVMLSEEEIVKKLGVNMEKDVVTCPVPYGGLVLFNNMTPHRSLNNLSENIRWSFDFRWQRPDMSAGFYGLKETLLFRSAKNPDYKIDWSFFADNMEFPPNPTESDFDTTIQGPWMLKWEITHPNKHTEKLQGDTPYVTWHDSRI